MDSETLRLKIIFAPIALDELAGIWRWNAQHHSTLRADEYLRYLKHNIDDLAVNHQKGREVGTRPEFRYIMVRRKARGHGHVVVYKSGGNEVHVLHIFHTAQDWQNRLSEEG